MVAAAGAWVASADSQIMSKLGGQGSLHFLDVYLCVLGLKCEASGRASDTHKVHDVISGRSPEVGLRVEALGVIPGRST